jgi:hypothetical protein
MSYLAYTLMDPRGGFRVYVGVTSTTLESRLDHHCWPSSLKSNDRRSNWIKKLLREGVRPAIEILEEFSDAESMYASEGYWIEQLRSWGYELINTQEGGKGWSGPRGPMSEAHKRSIANSLKGRKYRKHSEEAVLANSRRQGGTAIRDQYGNVYQTIAEACRKHNLSTERIYRILNGTRRTANGLTFTRIIEQEKSIS